MKRAKAVGLSENATEDQITAAEKKKADDDDAEDKKPAPTNESALEKLFNKKKATVTISDLKAAGFKTGFTSPLGPQGCTVGKYRLFRESLMDDNYTLSKIG